MGPSEVGGRGPQGMEHNGLYWGMGASWERSALPAPMVIELPVGPVSWRQERASSGRGD